MGRTVASTLGRPRWLCVAALAALATVGLFATIESPIYVQTVVLGGDRSPVARVRAFWQLVPLVGDGTDTVSDSLVCALAGLVGANVAVLGRHLTDETVRLRGGTGSALGVALGTLGAGCASCGVAIAAGLLGIVGGTAALAALPWGGTELLVLALGVNVLSLHWLVDGARATPVAGCPVDVE